MYVDGKFRGFTTHCMHAHTHRHLDIFDLVRGDDEREMATRLGLVSCVVCSTYIRTYTWQRYCTVRICHVCGCCCHSTSLKLLYPAVPTPPPSCHPHPPPPFSPPPLLLPQPDLEVTSITSVADALIQRTQYSTAQDHLRSTLAHACLLPGESHDHHMTIT